MTKKQRHGSVLEQLCAEYEAYGHYKVHVPSHHVYYVRAALKERTGKDFSVEDVEKALVAEGFLEYERG
jgi:deoxyribose-phosphate aldolase|tara:strand:- start:193 stop:399 length:207 start_codon:yes stop_codon:yes gene_type:complete